MRLITTCHELREANFEPRGGRRGGGGVLVTRVNGTDGSKCERLSSYCCFRVSRQLKFGGIKANQGLGLGRVGGGIDVFCRSTFHFTIQDMFL